MAEEMARPATSLLVSALISSPGPTSAATASRTSIAAVVEGVAAIAFEQDDAGAMHAVGHQHGGDGGASKPLGKILVRKRDPPFGPGGRRHGDRRILVGRFLHRILDRGDDLRPFAKHRRMRHGNEPHALAVQKADADARAIKPARQLVGERQGRRTE